MFMLTHLCSVFKTQWSFSTFFHTMQDNALHVIILYSDGVGIQHTWDKHFTSYRVFKNKSIKFFCSRCALVFDVCVTFERPAIPHPCQNAKKVKWALVMWYTLLFEAERFVPSPLGLDVTRGRTNDLHVLRLKAQP